MVVILVGASSTGKSSISDALFSNFAYERVISFTTRKPRPGATDGLDYVFIDETEFKNKIASGDIVEHEEYSQNRFYGSSRYQYLGDEDKVAILTPHGVRSLKKKMPELDLFVVYIKAPLKERAIRYINRCGSNFTYSDMTELSERMQRDFGMFNGFEDEADLIIENSDEYTPQIQAFTIVTAIERRKNQSNERN